MTASGDSKRAAFARRREEAAAKMPKLMTVSEFAAACEVDPSTVRRWIKLRKVAHYVLPGGQYRVPADELQLRGGPQSF